MALPVVPLHQMMALIYGGQTETADMRKSAEATLSTIFHRRSMGPWTAAELVELGQRTRAMEFLWKGIRKPVFSTDSVVDLWVLRSAIQYVIDDFEVEELAYSREIRILSDLIGTYTDDKSTHVNCKPDALPDNFNFDNIPSNHDWWKRDVFELSRSRNR